MTNQYYTYLWKDPKTNLPIYVGKGCNKRAWKHLKENTRIGNLLRKRISEGYNPQPIIHNEVDEKHAHFMEEVWIEQYGREKTGEGTLFNITAGGDSPPSRKGITPSAEHKAKISEANIKAQNRPEVIAKKSAANKGKIFSVETKIKMSVSHKGRNHSYKKGKTLSAEHKGRNHSYKKGKTLSAEHKAKLSLAKQKPIMTHTGPYASPTIAANANNINISTIWNRIKSRPKEYYYISKEEYASFTEKAI
jgi:hypothetical protein